MSFQCGQFVSFLQKNHPTFSEIQQLNDGKNYRKLRAFIPQFHQNI